MGFWDFEIFLNNETTTMKNIIKPKLNNETNLVDYGPSITECFDKIY